VLLVPAAPGLARTPVPLPSAGAAVPAPVAAPAEASAAAVAAARDAVYPALVNLTVVQETFSGGRTVRVPTNGSGVVVSEDGLVLTNYHVAGDALRITATLTSGEVLDADVVAHDPLTDLSVLRLVPETAGRSFAAAALGDSAALEVGDPVLAMGNPLALSSSVSLGIVSNPRRVFTDFAGSRLEEMDLGSGERTGVFTRWIQHDALILPGNSGGPLVDLAGRVVGINELGGNGLGFAIPAAVAARVLAQAVAAGGVRRGWLGFQVLPVAKLGLEEGVLVSSVLPGSPAETAGLDPGDVLLSLAGEPVTVRFFEQVPPLYQRVAELPVGSRVELVVERGGERRTLTVEVEEMEPSVGEQGELPRLGATVQEITGPMALARSLPAAGGLLVTGVRPGSPLEAGRPAVVAGDVLLRFAGTPLDRVEGLEAAVEAGLAVDGARALVRFRRGREELVTVITADPELRRRQGGELPAAWLGVQTQVLTPQIAAALGLPSDGGFRVTAVYPATAAAAAGLAVDDVLVAFDGEPLSAGRQQDREDLRRLVEHRAPGEEVTLGVLRPAGGDGAAVDGAAAAGPRRLELAVILDERPAEPGIEDRLREETLEVAVRDVAFSDRLAHDWDPDAAGAVVVEVEPGSWAQMAGLRLGDLVLRVGGERVAGADSFAAAIDEALARRPEVIPLFVRRGQRTHFVFIEPDWPEPGD
jgi:serine protease Do